MRVLVWIGAKDQLCLNAEAIQEINEKSTSKLRVVGVLNGDATAETTFEQSKEHQLMLHTMAPELVTNSNDEIDQGKRPLLWVHQDPRSDIVVLHSNNEHLGRLLLVLLSSVLLYSQDSELNFDKLNWISSLPSQLKIRGNQDEAGVAKDLGSHMPRFVWIARNSKVKWLKDPTTGAALSPTEYFNVLLTLDAGFSEASMQTNAFKTYFSTFFPQRDTVMLSRAVDVNAGIDLSWDTPIDTLRPAYVSSLEKLYSRYLSQDAGEDTVPVKKLQGNALTFGQFELLLSAYIEALNNHQVPVLTNAATKIIQATCEIGIAKASALYSETFDSFVKGNHGPLSSRTLILAHLRSLSAASLAIFTLTQQIPSANTAATALFGEKVKAMHEQIDAKYLDLVTSNSELSKSTCDEILATLNPVAFSTATTELEGRSREDFPDGLHSMLLGIKNNLQGSLAEYRGKAQVGTKSQIDIDSGLGPAMYSSLLSYLSGEILSSVIEWGRQVLRLFEKHMKAAEDEKDELENEYEIAQASDLSASALDVGDQRKLFEDELAARTEQLANMKSGLTAELEDKRTELERLLLDLRGMQSKHDARVASAEAEIERIKAKTVEVEAQAQSERLRREQLVQGAASEILNLESNFHAEQKNLYNEQRELMGKVIELERALMGKKTAHLQTLFEMETNCTKAVEEIRNKNKKEMQELKTQAKQDISMLKKAYDSKKVVVQQQLDEVNVLVKQCEEQLSTLEPKLNLTTPLPVAGPRTSTSNGQTFPSPSKPSGSSASRGDEMCKQS